MEKVLNIIKDTFYPEPYPTIEDSIEESLLHLSRKSLFDTKYVLLVNEFSADMNLKELVRKQKSQLEIYYNATLVNGVGVLQIYIGKYTDWKHMKNKSKPDIHGAQSIILQGILFIDPQDKKYELLRSQWGPIKFGNFQGQINNAYVLLEKLGFPLRKQKRRG